MTALSPPPRWRPSLYSMEMVSYFPFFFLTFHSYSFHSCSELGKISALYVCLSFTIIFSFLISELGKILALHVCLSSIIIFSLFLISIFSQYKLVCPQPFKKMRNLQVTCAHSLPLEWSSVLPRLSACSPMSNKNMV